MSKFFRSLFGLVLLFILPFIILIRGAVYLHISSNYKPWFCIFIAVIFTTTLVFLYLSFLRPLFLSGTDNFEDYKRRLIISLILVGLYSIHGLFYLSANNFKTSDIKSEIRKVHPVLRLAVSTLIFLDESLIITDAKRQPEDYKKMGLKSIKNSLHYKQSTGYAHALDIRTSDKPEWKNLLIQAYFRIMGFKTLRHKGTADHLHISLLSHDRPSAI